MEDLINHPTHYTAENIVITKTTVYEPIQFCEQLGFNLGNAFKYLFRAKHKGNELQDLKKAEFYLIRFLDNSLFPLDAPLQIPFTDRECINAFIANKPFLAPLIHEGITYRGLTSILNNVRKQIKELDKKQE
jgi:hypothetical protein